MKKEKKTKQDETMILDQEETVENMEVEVLDPEEIETESAEEKLTTELEALNQKFLRVAADFENYKRRTTQEKDDLVKYSNSKVLGELLPVIDNFQLALGNASEQPEVQSFLKGMEMIYSQLMQVLEQAGLHKIDAVGQTFDPNRHEAIMQVSDETVDDETVLEELRAGYDFKGKVLRPAMVKVSTK